MFPGKTYRIQRVAFDNFVFRHILMDFSYIPAGSFMMGSPTSDTKSDDSERPQHQVTISKPFLMAQTPVTQEQWFAVMGTDPSEFKGPRRPVENIVWENAVFFCNGLSEMDGLPPAYDGFGSSLRLIPGSTGYRLPTEAEWEYACRARTTTPRYGDIDSIAWYDKNSGAQTHDVGQKEPNAWGLYDMLGNVWEWTWDRYGTYEAGSQTDPQGPASGSTRVIRGGSWNLYASFARAGRRLRDTPGYHDSGLGFRVCRTF